MPQCLVEITFLSRLLSSRKFVLLSSMITGICGVDFFTFFFFLTDAISLLFFVSRNLKL